MLFLGKFDGPVTLAEDLLGLTGSHLVRRHISDGRVHVLVVVPMHEVSHPASGVVHTGEGVGVGDVVLQSFEQRFDEGVIVAGSRTAALCQRSCRVRLMVLA